MFLLAQIGTNMCIYVYILSFDHTLSIHDISFMDRFSETMRWHSALTPKQLTNFLSNKQSLQLWPWISYNTVINGIIHDYQRGWYSVDIQLINMAHIPTAMNNIQLWPTMVDKYTSNRYYHLVMTHIAMENPRTKWWFLAGKIIYKWAIFHGYVK